MSDLETFEYVLKNQCSKKCLSLYSDIKHEHKQTVKPLDVISTVSAQLKAIQGADSFNTVLKKTKTLIKYKKSTFLSVNNLPVYEEPPKPTTKFDTQCVSDTELINIIEDAEILDVHQGMTQEFETTFCHENTEKLAEKCEEKDRDMRKEKDNIDKRKTQVFETTFYHVNTEQQAAKCEEKDSIHKDCGIIKEKEYSDKDRDIKTKEDDIELQSNTASNSIVTDNIEHKYRILEYKQNTTNINKVKSQTHNVNKRVQSADIQRNIVEKLAKIVSKNIGEHLKGSKAISDEETVNKVFEIDKGINIDDIEDEKEEETQLEAMSQILKPKSISKCIHDDNKSFEIDKKTDFEAKEYVYADNTQEELFSQIILPKVVTTPILDDTKAPKIDVEANFEQKDTQIELSQILIQKTVTKPIPDGKTFPEIKLSILNENNTQIEELSQILPSKSASKVVAINEAAISKDKNDICDNNTQFEENSQILNQCIEICDDDNSERPPSPIFISKNIKQNIVKSKSPSPLVFNLDKFEHFESIAIPLIDSNDFDTAKHVINSQLLDKELCIQMDDNVELKAKDVHQPLAQEIVEIQPLGCTITNTDIEFIDRATSEQILNELKDQKFKESAILKDEHSIDIFKDEILFSSDEDEDYNHKEVQDLPFTCALETSFYDQSDVLDKTMYVGFQTASNRSIQVCTGSFVKAKSILSDVVNDNITVTELVKNSDSSVKDRIDADQTEINSKTDIKQLNFGEMDIEESELNGIDKDVLNKSQTKHVDYVLSQENANFMGFMTANNNKINLSEKALARCKKVFQDIDFNENFDDENVEIPEIEVDKEANIKKGEITNSNMYPIDDGCIDDEIIQEFENIEMSLEEGKETNKDTASVDNENVKDPELTLKTEETFNDIYFYEDFKENADPNGGETVKLNKVTKLDIGFQTASNKKINISKEAFAKSKHIFQDLDTVELPNKREKSIDKIYKDENLNLPSTSSKAINKEEMINNSELLNINQPTTSKGFVGFKTANNKNIKISEKALSKTKHIFDDLDFTDLPKKDNKNYPKVEEKLNNIPQNNNFVGFKTANNKNIRISKEALAKTKSIFDNIDSTDFIFPRKNSQDAQENKLIPDKIRDHVKGLQIDNTTVKVSDKAEITFIDVQDFESEFTKDLVEETKPMPPTNTNLGFTTASNRKINISSDALAKTRNLFKDIDDSDFKLPAKVEKDPYPDVNKTTENDLPFKNVETENEHEIKIPTFQGFKTASNKEVKISKEAIIKTKNIFKDIDNSDTDYKDNISEKDSLFPSDKDGIETKPPSPVFKGFQTANKKPVTVSADALERSKKLLEVVDLQTFNEDQNTVDFCGFQTASKKQVKISKHALVKSKNIFKDIENMNIDNKKKEKSLYPEEILQEKDIVTEKIGFSGFHTASNKQVKISEDALAKSKKIFKHIDNINTENKTKSKSLYPEEILQEKDKIFDENNSISKTEDKLTNPIFKGFHTASKKPVAISKEALEKSKKLFQDIEEIGHDNAALSGFQTGHNKVVKVSEKAVTETKKLFDIDNLKCLSFKGFHTASNKSVNISEDALAKSKKIFQDLDDEIIKNDAKKTNFSVGFQSGNNKAIVISEEALAKSKRLFSEIDENVNISNKKDKKEPIHSNKIEENLIDTQVINNFEESFHTEDFRETPKQSKRSGSPILSCPSAKRRKKFETPYNTKNIPKPIAKPTEFPKNEKKITFTENYKKTKQYTLKDIENITKNTSVQIDPYFRNFTFDNLLEFQFNKERNDLSDNIINIDILKEYFLNSVNAKLVPKGWLENHIKLILWKLISYEVKFQSMICTARNLVDQLKYRYDKELYNVQRSALRKIFEKDDVPSKTLVLCVVAIYVDDVIVSSIKNASSTIELLLTDGWYCIRCVIDKMLSQLVCDNKITVGSKIATSGAEVMGAEQGVSPWEDTSSIRLKIYGNSTRRVRWDARLGYHANAAILSQLSSVKVNGGKVCKLRVYVARVYPPLFVEKFEDGSTVTRSERLENIHQMKTETERQVFMEKLYEEVEKEFDDQSSQDSEGLTDSLKRSMDSGSQIAKLMKKSKDPTEFRANLTPSQIRLLEAHTSRKRENLLNSIQTRVRERIEKERMFSDRNVVTLMNIRVVGLEHRDGRVVVTKGMMSVWKPNDAIREIIKEGAWIDVLNVIPTAIRYSEIQISAGRQSIFSTSKFKEPDNFKPYTKILKRQCYTVKDLSTNPTMTTDYNEVDTVGLIFLIDPSIQEFDSSKQSFQNVYLTDIDKNIICINFWGGLKKFGFQNVLNTGQVIACVNLQKRAGNSRKSIPQYRVIEFSYFTQTPRNENCKRLLEDLNKQFASLDRRKFCQECVVLKNTYSVVRQNNENISPYRFMNTDINISKNKIFVDSPLVRQNKVNDNFNLTGLDFESTFKQDSQLSEEVLKRKRKVNEKIARLKMYGEPPPLSPIHIINRSKQACNSYKSPLASSNTSKNLNQKENSELKIGDRNSKSDSSINVTSVKYSPQNSGKLDSEINGSPILLNRTYVKCVNPVKINFDVKDNNDSIVDHFADDFDGSPPLSLD